MHRHKLLIQILKSIKSSLTTIGLIFTIILISCSQNSKVTGGGSDTEIVGIIKDNSGIVVEGAIVSIFPEDYSPTMSNTINETQIDTTNSKGEYRLIISNPGIYNIVVQFNDQSVIKKSINISDSPIDTIADLTLLSSGTIKVIIPTISRDYNEQIYISGTDIAIAFDRWSDTATLSNAPANVPLNIYSTIGYLSENLLIDSLITVEPTDTIIICHKVKVLFMVDTSLTWSPSLNLGLMLQDTFTDVTIRSIHILDTTLINDYDVIYFGADVDSLYGLNDFFLNLNLPLIVASSDLYPLLKMTRDNNFGTENVSNMAVLRTHGTLPDTSKLYTSLSLFDLTDPIPTVEWGIPAGSYMNIGVSSGVDPKRSYYFEFTPNSILSDNTPAINYRIGILGSNTNHFNDTGRLITWRALHWMGELSAIE